MYTELEFNKRKYLPYADDIPYSPSVKNKNLFLPGGDMNLPFDYIKEGFKEGLLFKPTYIPEFQLAKQGELGEVSKPNTLNNTNFNGTFQDLNNTFFKSKEGNIDKANSVNIPSLLYNTAANIGGSIVGRSIAGNKTSNIGSSIDSIGTGIGEAVATVNPFLGAGITAAAKIGAGFYNWGWGNDEAKLAEYNLNIGLLSNTNIQGGNSDLVYQLLAALLNPATTIDRNAFGHYNNKLWRDFVNKQNYFEDLLNLRAGNAVLNVLKEDIENNMRTISAFGGKINIGDEIELTDELLKNYNKLGYKFKILK